MSANCELIFLISAEHHVRCVGWDFFLPPFFTFLRFFHFPILTYPFDFPSIPLLHVHLIVTFIYNERCPDFLGDFPSPLS